MLASSLLLPYSSFSQPTQINQIKRQPPLPQPIFQPILQFNYLLQNQNPFTQLIFIPQFNFHSIPLKFALSLPLSFDRNYNLKSIDYNNIYSILSKLHYFQYSQLSETSYQNHFNSHNPHNSHNSHNSFLKLKISSIHDITWNQGLIIQHYSNNISYPEIRNLGLQMQFTLLKGFHLYTILGNIFTQSLLATQLALHYGQLFNSQAPLLQNLVISFSFASDPSPKRLNTIQINSSYNHKIVQTSSKSPSALATSFNLQTTLLQNYNFSLDLHLALAKLSPSGESIAYGFSSNLFPHSLNLLLQFQFRHFFNSFIPAYFDSFYDVLRSFKIDSSQSKNSKKYKLGFLIQLSRYFSSNQMAIVLSYDKTFLHDSQSLLFFKFFTLNIPQGFFFLIQLSRYNLSQLSHLYQFQNLDTLFKLNLSYRFNSYFSLALSFHKGLVIEQHDSQNQLQNLRSVTISTSLFF